MSQLLKAEEALREFERGQFRPVYLLYGEESFLFDEIVGSARRKLAPPGLEDFNLNRFDGAVADGRDIAAAAQTLPFMAERRLVLVTEARFFRPARRRAVRDAEEAEGGAATDETREGPTEGRPSGGGDAGGDPGGDPGGGDAGGDPSGVELPAESDGDDGAGESALLAYLADPSPSTCLIFTLTSDRERRLPEPDRRRKMTKAVEKVGALVQCARLKDWQAARWAVERAGRFGRRLDQETALELVHTVGEDLRTIASELQKLILYVGRAESITVQDIAAVASPTAERRVWDLLDALGYRRRGEALELLRSLYRQGVHPLAVMGLLTMQLRRLLRVRALMDAGKDQAAVAAGLGLPPFLTARLIEQARGFTSVELTAALTRVFETDLMIKTTEVDPAMAVELLLLQLV